jgi:MFS family permease
MIAIFCSAVMISLFIGPPIGGLLLMLEGILGLHGWQWLFITEALPPVIMSAVTLKLLTDWPTEADWLRPEQRQWLEERLASEEARQDAVRKISLAGTFYNPTAWLLAVTALGQNMASWGVAFFLPPIAKGLGVPIGMIGLVSGIPYAFALAAINVRGWHSDRTGERPWHAASAWLLSAAGLAAAAITGAGHPVLVMVALSCAIMGQYANQPAVWAMPSALLTGAAAAGGMAMINTVGQLGGWFGPSIFGMVKDATGSNTFGLLCLALAPVMSAIAVLVAGRRMERSPRQACSTG